MSGSRAETFAARRAADAEARRLAQCQFEAPLIIEAGAGTGKTATLVARVLAWCLDEGWKKACEEDAEADALGTAERVLRGVVAITFTEAAAAEMDARIESALADLDRGERPVGFDGEAPRERVEALRAALDHLSVQTIHAWCRRLLSDHPLEADVHPLFEVDADGAAREEAVREVAGARLAEAYAAHDPELLALAERGVGPGEIERALTVQLASGVTAVELAADPLAPARIEALCARFLAAHEALERAGGGLLGTPKRGKKGGAVEAALERALPLVSKPIQSPAELGRLCEGLVEAWEDSARGALAKWRSGEFAAAESAAYGGRTGAIQAAAGPLHELLGHAEALDPEAMALLAPVLAALGAEVEERLRRSGRLGFDTLLSRTAALLSRGDVVGRVRAGIDQLLVDEFQDTDPRQCAIVSALALEGPKGERPGLFLVGDPKQSIYGWRSADLAAYEALLDRAMGEGGRKEPLCVNHRSVPAVLDAVERAIAPVMRREAGFQPEFQGLAPSEKLESEAGFELAGRAPVEVWIPARCDADGLPETTRTSDAAAIEARAVARDLRALYDGGMIAWKDVGLLFRSRGEWDIYLGALREANIPYRVEGDRSYYRRREILDAAALVCGVLDPNDALALVALLRSSAAGVPDAAWIPLWEGGLPGLCARLGEGESEDDSAVLAEVRALLLSVAGAIDPALPGLSRVSGWEHAAAACLEAMAALRRSFMEESGDRFVERLRALTAFEGVEAARFLGRWRSANLERFFTDHAATLAAAGSPDAALRSLRRAVAEEELPSVEPAVLDAGDAVSVVTLHGAKGLAWEHVYLLQLHKGESNQTPPDDAGSVEGLLEGRWCKWPTPGYDALDRRRKRVADAERVRTLYVGMTRAKQRLVLSGLWPARRGSAAATLSALLAEGVGSDVDLAVLAGDAGEAGWVEHAGWRWGFVDRADGSAEAGAADEGEAATAVTLPVASAGNGASDREAPVAAAPSRAAAAFRMARFRGASVTAIAAEAEPEPEKRTTSAPAGIGRSAALRVGTAIHAALERLDLGAAPATAWPRQRESIEADLRRSLAPAAADKALRDALALWDAVAAGPLAERLTELAPRLIARELPLLLPLAGDPESRDRAEYVSGAIDLLYSDPDGRLVVADFKSDRRDDSAESADSGADHTAYARQGALYCAAVAQALGAERPPRFELWWLRSGEVENVEV